jgi:hypothetical protein
MPFVDIPFCLELISPMTTVCATTLSPAFVRTLGNLLMKAHIFVHIEN